MAFDAARYTTGMRYDPTLNTGRYPAAPAVGPLAPPTTDPGVTPPALSAPIPASPSPPIWAGSVPMESFGGEGTAGGGIDATAGQPGPSPDQSLGALGNAALTGLGFAVSPMSSFAGMLASLTYDGMKGNLPGTTRPGLLGILQSEFAAPSPTTEFDGTIDGSLSHEQQAAIIGHPTMNTGLIQAQTQPSVLGGKGDLGDAIAENSLGGGIDGGAKAGGYGSVAEGSAGDGAQAEAGGSANGSQEGGGDGGSKWMSGGYTGAGDDGAVQPDAPAGTVHEGEVVLSAPAVDYYGPELLLLLNDMAIPRSRLAALVQGE